MPSRKCISIDLGEKNLHILEGTYKSGVVEISKAFSLETPDGSVVDGSIEVIEPLRNIIGTALKQHKIHTRNVIFTIQSTSIVTRDIILPIMEARRLSSAADYEMEQQMPISIGLYDVGHRLAGEITEGGARMWKIRSAAVPRELVDSCYELATGLKLVPLALDIHYNSVSKLFTNGISINGEDFDPEKTYALVDMGHKNTGIHIIANKRLEFSRLVPFGGRNLDIAVSARYDFDLNKAEQEKKELHLEDEECVLRPLMFQHLAELQKILHYYTSRHGGNKVQTVFFYGGGAGMKGLEGFAGQFLDLRSVAVTDLNAVKKNKKTDIRKIGSYMNAAGALIRL